MEPSTKLLTQRLQQLPDAELLAHLREGTLIPQALEIATDILKSRGLLSGDGTPPASRQASAAGEQAWVMVAEFDHPHEADVLRVHLESHDVLTFVSSERPHVLPLAADRHGHPAAVAAIRLHVRREQLWQAKEALGAFARAHSVPDGLLEQDPLMPTCQQGVRPAPPRRQWVIGRWRGRVLIVLAVLIITLLIGVLAAG